MSLLDARMTACVRLIETGAPDGLGGTDARWTEGERFPAALVWEDCDPRREADRETGASACAVLTSRDVHLEFHDVLRLSDGTVLRIVSNGEDTQTPPTATLDLRAARAERWVLPE